MNPTPLLSNDHPSASPWGLMGLTTIVIFITDVFLPLGVAGGVPYILVILLSLRHRNSQVPIWAAIGCSSLTILGIFLSPTGGELWKALTNRGLALFAIWTTTFMGRYHLQQSHTLQAQEKTIQDFTTAMPTACFSFDRAGKILSWNPAAERIYGYSKKEAVGASSYDLIVTPETYEDTKNVIAAIFQGKTFESMMWHDRNKQGELGWRTGNLFPVIDIQGQVSYGVNMNIDISKQKAAESELKTKNALLKAILDSSTDAIYAKDREGKYLLVNHAAANVIGKPPETILGFDDSQLFDAESANFLNEFDKIIFSKIQSINTEETLSVRGNKTVFSTIKSPLKDTMGKTFGLVGVSRDITDWKQTQKDLLLTDRVFMASPDHISIVDRDYRYRRVNTMYQHVHQKFSNEIVGMSVSDLFGKEVFQQTIKPMLDRCFQGEEVYYEAWFTFAGGQQRYMAVSYLPLTREDQDIQEIVVIGRDWTERKQMEEALHDSERRLRTILDSMICFVGIWAPDGTFLDCNQFSLNVAGLQRSDVIGKHITETYWINDSPETQQQIRTIFDQVVQGKMVRKDVRVRSADHKHLIIDACYVPIRDEHGAVIQLVGSGIDVTERKNLENMIRQQNEELELEVYRRTSRIQELEQRRMQVEKLAALAQIAAGVAHEINNPLASISQSLVLLKRAIPTEHPHFRYMAKVEDCIDRIAKITQHLFHLYRPSSPTPRRINLRTPVQNAVEIMRARASRHEVHLILVDDPPTPLFATVPNGELIQVLCNLIQNAIETSQPDDTIEVSIGSELNTATISVLDHGIGISPDVASHIFEPFFTTKQGQTEGGMGLGLAISHSLIEAMGGTLDFSTSIGQGSIFTITLPRT